MADIHVVVLAAGKGTRMKSALPKVLHRVAGLPLIDHVLRAAASLQPASVVVVVGHGAEELKARLGGDRGLRFAVQEPQLGTGHALLQAEPHLRRATGTVLMLSGDVPLLRPSTLRRLVDRHEETKAAATVLTAIVERPYGYGRILRANGRVAAVVEERDASAAQREIQEINTGVYAFDAAPLFDALRGLTAGNAQGEYYLTDLVGLYRGRQHPVETVAVTDPDEVRGINSRTELAEVSRIVRQAKNEELMAAGVTLEDPATTYIGVDVVVGRDTVIHPGVMLEGRTRIGSACEIHAGARIVDSVLDDRVIVRNYCVVTDAHLSTGSTVGPFAHIRPGTDLGENARIGNFVELKNTVMGAGSKASHLSYLGDATIGARVNIGAGTITCNYDGRAKHRTRSATTCSSAATRS